MKKALLVAIVAGMIASWTAVQTEAGDKATDRKHPNIVFILADDMGYGDLKVYNPESRIPTPHLDRLAAEGMTFLDAHSGGSTCVPSRYSLMTGRFAARIASLNWRRGPVISEQRSTISRLLKDNGYATAMVGKWHLGFEAKPPGGGKTPALDYSRPLTGGPMDRGFDAFFGMHASLDIPPYFYIRDRTPTMPPTDAIAANSSVDGDEGWNHIQGAFWRAGPVGPDFKHAEVTPRFAREAVKVIEKHGARKDSSPLFLYLALPSPHTPWLPTQEFAGKSGAGMYGDFMMQVDGVVGQLMDSLEKTGMKENTLVIFSSDNGPVWYDKDIQKFKHNSSGPLRGIKGSVWEGGHRVPFIASWPAQVKAGSVNRGTIAFADVYATFAEIVGQKEIAPGTAEDSESFLGRLLGKAPKEQSRPPILHSKRCIRADKWKLLLHTANRGFGADRRRTRPMELYNLKDDLGETKNLVEAEPERVKSLTEKIKKILDQ